MARPIWKGHISFGLVNVPVTLYSAEQKSELRFNLIDSRNSSRVRYERVNEETGREVPWDKIVKGFEYNEGNYVLLSDQAFERASPELTKTIEIEQFVDLDAIDPVYFDKPYYLVPGKGGEKGYVLLREAMLKSNRVGIAQVVIRSRGQLAALLPRGDALILDVLRYAQEVRPLSEFELPDQKLSAYKITRREQELAYQLIEGMAGEWDPSKYHDEYREALMKYIEERIESGDTEEVAEEEDPEPEAPHTVNFMDVLKKSVAKTATASKKTSKKSTGRKRASRKKKAG